MASGPGSLRGQPQKAINHGSEKHERLNVPLESACNASRYAATWMLASVYDTRRHGQRVVHLSTWCLCPKLRPSRGVRDEQA